MNFPKLRCLALFLGLAAPLHVVAQDSTDRRDSTKLSTIIIYTPQMKALAKFYEQALEFPAPSTVFDNHIGYWLGGNYVGFEPTESPVRNPGGVSAWFQVTDIEKTFHRLLKMGAKKKMKPEPQPWGDLHATVIDPDGNLLGLIQSKKGQ